MSVLAVLAAAWTLAAAPTGAEAPTVQAGRLVAQRNCGGCHAVAEGASPFADAPPFRTLHQRYGAGGLAELLERGMLADHPHRLDEGPGEPNPRMPAMRLDEDEIANLVAYLRSLEPAR
jgi:mono/diheme cytochrome c family protein